MLEIQGIRVWGDPIDDGALEQIVRCRANQACVGAAMMADHHLGYAVPIGGVMVYNDAVSPSGVGYDIACGNKAALKKLHEARERLVRVAIDEALA